MNFTPTRSAKVENTFVGDGEYTLCLRIDELITLQEKLNSGPLAIYQRLVSGGWNVGDISETVRLALIGGGMNAHQAFHIVKNYITEGSLFYYVDIAQTALMAAIFGVEEEREEADDGDENPPKAPTDSSAGATSSPSAEWLDSHLNKSE